MGRELAIEAVLAAGGSNNLNGADPAPFGRDFAALGRLARKIAYAVTAPNRRRLISRPRWAGCGD